MNRKELAIAYHDKKYNCAQAVACSLAKDLGVEEETLFKACEGFGLGMGGMCATCGAISGAVMAAGFKNSDGNLADPKTKADTYKLSKEIVNQFIEKNGSAVCRDLKGVDTGKALRSCPDCIMDAVEIAEKVLEIE
ncbi:MAG: C-GCAxxG-C-C family protein [Lachnospiraceae bacterium]|nr:C-GCAxxG-C-C family protein [Lachnospiraceae bacterium]